MIDLVLGPLILMGGYFLNGGVGVLMQPGAPASGSGPPPGSSFIVTQDGTTKITTQGGVPLVTG